MHVLDKIKKLREFINLEEFNNKILAITGIDLIKVKYLYEKYNKDTFIKSYFLNFNFANTELFVKGNTNKVYYPKNITKYFEILGLISIDIEITNNLSIIDNIYGLNITIPKNYELNLELDYKEFLEYYNKKDFITIYQSF